MARKPAAQLARETMEILGRGHYEAGGQRHEVAGAAAEAVENTEEFAPDDPVSWGRSEFFETRREARNTSSLEAAELLRSEGFSPCILNFASAKNPGGGFLNGARAQEESLARSSGLYPCLLSREMYQHHRLQHDPLYSDWVIYSPAVPVFRSNDGGLLDPWYACSFLTSPACNAGAAFDQAPRSEHRPLQQAIRRAMRRRVERVLSVAASKGERALVLGAWGCGVFRNDPGEVAGLFKEALDGSFSGVFRRVIFAVLDTSNERRFLGPFADRFSEVR